MVRKERFKLITVQHFVGDLCYHVTVTDSVAELLQHEIDHLDGILAIDVPYGTQPIIARSEYLQHRGLYDGQVDYTIVPTISPTVAAPTGSDEDDAGAVQSLPPKSRRKGAVETFLCEIPRA